jgi:hypothetical protein
MRRDQLHKMGITLFYSVRTWSGLTRASSNQGFAKKSQSFVIWVTCDRGLPAWPMYPEQARLQSSMAMRHIGA